MARYAVEARIFSTGKIMAKVRLAHEGEESGCQETRLCDVWMDIFDNKPDAERFCAEYKKA